MLQEKHFSGSGISRPLSPEALFSLSAGHVSSPVASIIVDVQPAVLPGDIIPLRLPIVPVNCPGLPVVRIVGPIIRVVLPVIRAVLEVIGIILPVVGVVFSVPGLSLGCPYPNQDDHQPQESFHEGISFLAFIQLPPEPG